MIYLLTVKEILILSNNIYLFTKSIIIRGNYIRDTKLYAFQRNRLTSFKEIYPRSTTDILSGKLYPFKEIYLFKEHIFVQVQGHMFHFKETTFIEYCCIRGIAEIFIQKLSPATL